MNEATQAQFSAPWSWPANSAFLIENNGRVLLSMILESLDAAVVGGTGEAVPVVQGVADVFGDHRLAKMRASCCSSQALSASTRGLLFSCRTARRSPAQRPRIVFSTA
jgi:hypothetical protein